MVRRSRQVGPLHFFIGERTMDRRRTSWCGVGPMWVDPEADRPRAVVGFCVHAGKHYVVIDWAVLRRDKVWPYAVRTTR